MRLSPVLRLAPLALGLACAKEKPLSERIVGTFVQHEGTKTSAQTFKPGGAYEEVAHFGRSEPYGHEGRYVVVGDTVFLQFGTPPTSGRPGIPAVLSGDTLRMVEQVGSTQAIFVREQPAK